MYFNYIRKKNLLSLFNNIYADNGEENNDNLIKVSSIGFLNCDYCDPALCKTLLFNKFIKGVIVICDEKIDFCLSKNLNENDILCVRNNYSLYRILYEKNGLKEIKSKVEIWNNGLDIIKILENEFNK